MICSASVRESDCEGVAASGDSPMATGGGAAATAGGGAAGFGAVVTAAGFGAAVVTATGATGSFVNSGNAKSNTRSFS